MIDRIQCRAARWSLCNYDRYSSVTLMQHQLNWQNLQQRQKIARLLFIYLYNNSISPMHGFFENNSIVFEATPLKLGRCFLL